MLFFGDVALSEVEMRQNSALLELRFHSARRRMIAPKHEPDSLLTLTPAPLYYRLTMAANLIRE